MILLDTNVVSELIARSPNVSVVAWLDRQPATSLWTTSLTIYELRRGLGRLPTGGRREQLEEVISAFIAEVLESRIAPLDAAAADRAGRLNARRTSSGLTIDLADTLIAGIALSRRATLATRNVRHFADLETPVVDPWAG